jgi:hypothetical protein
MMGAVPDVVVELLRESLAAWRVAAIVTRNADGSVEVRAQAQAQATRLLIARAPPGLPFRWLVSTDDRQRGATGIAGLLRSVRSAIDVNYRPIRVRIASLPLVP